MDVFDHELDQLVSDPSFQRYALCQSPEDLHTWQQWLSNHPDKVELAARAKGIVQVLSASEQRPPAELVEQQWQAMSQQLAQVPKAQVRRIPRLLGIALAACLAGILFSVGMFVYQTPPALTIYETAYAESHTLTLPDGSRVTLNANSTLRHEATWSPDQPREVWLEGEAYFEVNKTPQVGAQQFVVHLEQVHIEVLGTTFNAKQRRNQTQVMLVEGSIQLQHDQQAAPLIVSPGELVAYDTHHRFVKQSVDPTPFIAWTQQRLVWQESSLREIANWIVDHYGVNVELSGSQAFAESTYSGEAEVHHLEDLLVLLEALGIEVIRKEGMLILGESEEP